jgi:SAM-dependent methyltransferase
MKFFKRNGHSLTADGVRSLYREHLGREVENEDVVANHLRQHKTIDSLRQAVLESPEYRANNLGRRLWSFLASNLHRPTAAIEVDATPAELQAMFDRVATQWATLGEQDAHWSVVTDERYRSLAFPSHAEEFFGSGRHTASLLELFAARNNVAIDGAHVLEFGCGTGRITAALAGSFGKVTAVDISQGHLDFCRESVAGGGQTNVDFVHLKSLDDATTLAPCSVLFSTIVLQHNPPPLAHYLLDQGLSKVAAGGVALFQVPTHFPDYAFCTADYLASPIPPAFEMHCLPMDRIFRLLHKHGFTPLEVIMDTWTGLPGSHTFFAVKSTARSPH